MRWSYRGLGQADRVELYTQQSFVVLLWLMPAAFVLPVLGGAGLPGWLPVFLVTMAVATAVELRFFRDWREPGPLEQALLVGSALVAAVVLRSSDLVGYDARAVAMALVWAVVWPLAGARGTLAIARLLGVAVLVGGIGTSAQSRAAWWVDASAGAIVALFVTAFSLFTVRLSVWIVTVVRELDEAREAQASLAVAEERLRFSRDVHDVMGRQLSTIARTSELAATLARRGDPDGAADRMAEVQGYADEALREARELARGYRAPTLEQEVAGARSLLEAAGITADLDVAGVPEDWQEAVALTIREGVTNILRHSRATAVRASWDGRVLELVNDGAGAPGGPGQGLTGLSERVEPRGGRIDTDYDAGRFLLRLTTPAAVTAAEARA